MAASVIQKFQADTEVEGLWLATEQANYFLLSMLAMTTILVFGLWDIAAHGRLLVWLLIMTALNGLRWQILRFYHTHKHHLTANIQQFKRITLVVSILSGLWYAMCVTWFLEPSQPLNVLIISVALMIAVIGAMLMWFCYVPAVIAISFPPALSLAILLFLQGNKAYIATSILLTMLTGFGVISSRKLAKMLNHALFLNFENAALRQESDQKTQLLEIALAETLKREQALEQARQEAEQANTAKTRFLAAASHDLRQPVHALGLFFAELSEQVYNLETATIIAQIEAAIASINSMLNALLDVSKLDAGIVRPIRENFGLAEMFTRLRTEFQPIAREHHNQLRIIPTALSGDTDPTMLERMLRNLISNALNYTQNGRVIVAARQRGSKVHIRVLDNGIGIPQTQRDNIFIEFQQLPNPARRRQQGLGLGLAIVKRLAQLLQHDLRVTSRVGRGSCFTLMLPSVHPIAIDKPPSPSAVQAHRPNYALTGLQVLVLDDDSAVLEGMRGLLTRWGCEVIATRSATEAMDKVQQPMQALDVLMIDYRLSDNVSGLDVASKLLNYLNAPVAVLIITGDTDPERLREAEASGYPLLHKPVQPTRLRSTLQYLMTRR